MAAIAHSTENIGDAYAPSLNAAFADLASAFGFWPVVLAPYGGARTVAEQRAINPAISPLLSDHVKGRAVDINNQRSFRNVNQKLFLSILANHGWRNVQVNGAPFTAEPWHFANQSTNPAGGDATPLPTPEEDAVFGTFIDISQPAKGYTLLGDAGTWLGISPAVHSVLNAQGLIAQRPTKQMSTADHAALIALFPPVNSGGDLELSDADVAEIVAALGHANNADVLAAIARLDTQSDTYQAQVLAALANVDEATLATFGLKRA